MKKYYYIYQILYKTSWADEPYTYIGFRGCNCHPTEDHYVGSSKYTPNDKILGKVVIHIFTGPNRLQNAIEAEAWHHKFADVKCHPYYFNRCNATKNGFTTAGIKKSKEAVLKTAEANRGRKTSEKTKTKIRKALKGRKRPDRSKEWSKSISEAKKGIKNPKLSEYLKGKKQSEEHRKNNAEARRGLKRSEVTKDRISKASKGKKKSRQHCENISKAKREKWGELYLFINDKLGKEIIATLFDAKQNSKEWFGICPSSVQGLKLGIHRASKGWTCSCVLPFNTTVRFKNFK